MSKSNAIRALLGTLVLCVPAVAATTISDTEVGIRLIGLAQSAPDTYELTVGSVALLQVTADPGSMLVVLAFPLDKWGQPEISFPLVLPQKVDASGRYYQFFTIPAVAAGMTFRIQAASFDPMNLLKVSTPVTISVSDAQILHAPAARPRLAQARPAGVD